MRSETQAGWWRGRGWRDDLGGSAGIVLGVYCPLISRLVLLAQAVNVLGL